MSEPVVSMTPWDYKRFWLLVLGIAGVLLLFFLNRIATALEQIARTMKP